MKQTQALSLPEAIIFVERAFRGHFADDIQAQVILNEITPRLMQVLQRDGSDVETQGYHTEVAVFAMLVMSLAFFNRCNALVLTDTEFHRNDFFAHRLGSWGPTASTLASSCGKTLRQIVAKTNPEAIALALHDHDTIPLMDFAVFDRVRAELLTATVTLAPPKNTSWWGKLFSPPAVSPGVITVQEGLANLNCVVKVFGDTVNTDDQAGVEPILMWAAQRQLS